MIVRGLQKVGNTYVCRTCSEACGKTVLPHLCECSCTRNVRVTQSVNGPGTELKALLAGWPFRIVATPDCKCTSRAAYMDAKGCDWCESPDGMAEIMGFLREAAEERGLPFFDTAARLLVRRAIANARKAEARRAKEAEAAAAAEGPAA